ncbi:MAG: hypothetical protein ABI743_11970 [bacterium]
MDTKPELEEIFSRSTDPRYAVVQQDAIMKKSRLRRAGVILACDKGDSRLVAESWHPYSREWSDRDLESWLHMDHPFLEIAKQTGGWWGKRALDPLAVRALKKVVDEKRTFDPGGRSLFAAEQDLAASITGRESEFVLIAHSAIVRNYTLEACMAGKGYLADHTDTGIGLLMYDILPFDQEKNEGEALLVPVGSLLWGSRNGSVNTRRNAVASFLQISLEWAFTYFHQQPVRSVLCGKSKLE